VRVDCEETNEVNRTGHVLDHDHVLVTCGKLEVVVFLETSHLVVKGYRGGVCGCFIVCIHIKRTKLIGSALRHGNKQ
jgi:hypothetical protein